jgi:hypothetical protein
MTAVGVRATSRPTHGPIRLSGERRIEDPLPKMPSVHKQWVRCGRARCQCASGKLHGPYFATFRRESGRLVKRYVRLADAAQAMRDDEAERRRRRDATVRLRASRAVLRGIRATVREVERGA